MLLKLNLARQYKRTTVLVYFCIGCLAGVYLSFYLGFSWYYILPVLVFIQYLFDRRALSIMLCAFLGVLLGLYRANYTNNHRSALDGYIGQKIELIVTAKEDGAYDRLKRISFDGVAGEMLAPNYQKISVPIRVSSYLSTGVFIGDKVKVSGKLYKGFGSKPVSVGYAEIEVIGKSSSLTNQIRSNFIAISQDNLPEPEASLAVGLLIGQKTGLSSEMQDIFRKAGLTHIIAVSGYNLTIIIRALKKSSNKLSRFQILSIGTTLILLFTGITGFSPSIIRALIVCFIILISWYFGKNPKPHVILLLSLAISALLDPSQLFSSVGWYLSFAAFTGVMIIAPIFISKIKKQTLIKSILVESMSASLMTLPIISLVFSRISITGIFANVIVLPLVPVTMLLSFLNYVSSLLSEGMGIIISLPTKYLLKIIIDTADVISRLPGSDISINTNKSTVIMLYVAILGPAFLIYTKNKSQNMLQ